MAFNFSGALSVDLGGTAPAASSSGSAFSLVAGAFARGELTVASFVGEERLNELYAYDVLVMPKASLDAGSLRTGTLGLPACLTLRVAEHKPRVVQGLVSSVAALGRADRPVYRLRIVPRMWILTQRRRPRVFQDQSVREIVSSVLESAKVAFEWRHTPTAERPWPFCYQRDESDFAFVKRLLATVGVSFAFEHAHGLLEELMPGATAYASLAVDPKALSADALGGGVLGAAASGAAGILASATKVVFFDDPCRAPIVGDAVAVTDAIGGVADAVGGAIGGAFGGAVGELAGAALGQAADHLPFDADVGGADQEEQVSEFELWRNVRTKRAIVHDYEPIQHRNNLSVAETSTLESVLDYQFDLSVSACMKRTKLGALGAVKARVPGLDPHALDLGSPLPTADELVVEEHDLDPSLDHPGFEFLTSNVDVPRRALEQLRHDVVHGKGKSNSPRLAPGYRFFLDRHPVGECNREYLVTAVHCVGKDPVYDVESEVSRTFEVEFEVVPAFGRVRPPKPAPAPRMGLELATVVGPDGCDTFTDGLGRVQVRFHWAGQTTEEAEQRPDFLGMSQNTCFVPVLTPWGGPGYGMQQTLRVGMEVVVGFLGGQAERPVVMGCMHTMWKAQPFAGDPAVVGTKTRSIPEDGNWNELSFDDNRGREVVRVRAARDLREEVLRDLAASVGRNSSTNVGGEMSLNVQGNASEQLGANHREDVAGDRDTRIGGQARTSIDGPTSLVVGEACEVQIGGRTRLTLEDECGIRVRKDAVAKFSGSLVNVVGDSSAKRSFVQHVEGRTQLFSTDDIVIASGKRIVLECGESRILMTEKSVEIHSPNVFISGETTKMGGASLAVGYKDEAKVMAASIEWASSGAKATLAGDLQLASGSIKLKSGGGASGDDAQQKEKKLTTIQLKDQDGKPMPLQPFVVRLADGSEFGGVLDENGEAKIAVDGAAEVYFVDTAGPIRKN